MNTKFHTCHSGAPGGRKAFSLIEILMTVAMLSVIILGLVAMFDQTRRAFTSSMTQVDLLESGRATAAFIANDLEQMTPVYDPNIENFYMTTRQLPPFIVQPLTDPTENRTNALDELYFISRNNTNWNITGYRLDTASEQKGIGRLYRYCVANIPVIQTNFALTNVAASNLISQVSDFTTNFPTNGLTPIIDGVVDFRIRAYDMGGHLIPQQTNTFGITALTNTVTGPPGEYNFYRFMSNAVPAFVEIELGVLENRTLQHYYSMTNNMPVALGYLTNHAGQVHLFRQRVPIRAVDATAYSNISTALP